MSFVFQSNLSTKTIHNIGHKCWKNQLPLGIPKISKIFQENTYCKDKGFSKSELYH